MQATNSVDARPSGPEPDVRRVSVVDWLMVVLAVFSVGLLTWALLSDLTDRQERRVFWIDTAICGVFFVEFCFRWRREGGGIRFVGRNWYEVLGMIPAAHPALRGFRLLRIVVLVIRLWRASDRAFGAGFTYGLVNRLAEPIVEAIRRPITIAVLDEVVAVLETGDYPTNLAEALGENREELRGIVAEKIKEDPYAGTLKRLPFHDEVVAAVIDTAFRVVLEVLKDQRVDDFFAHVLNENRAQIRQAVLEGAHRRDAATD